VVSPHLSHKSSQIRRGGDHFKGSLRWKRGKEQQNGHHARRAKKPIEGMNKSEANHGCASLVTVGAMGADKEFNREHTHPDGLIAIEGVIPAPLQSEAGEMGWPVRDLPRNSVAIIGGLWDEVIFG
tara:strand:- start:74 stop:451 length:378 start_codon:yes stop_codon:yes gene_type:complete